MNVPSVNVPGDAIGIVGAGRVARAFGQLLVAAGEPVVCVVGRDPNHAADAAQSMGPGVRAVTYADLPRSVARWIVAVPDRALGEVAVALAEHAGARVALHTCGARGPEALAPLQARGVDCGAIHPLQTFSGTRTGALYGIAFAVWGSAPAVAWAERIVALARGEILRIPPELRPRYHAAAVMTSNYVMALLDAGQALLAQCGIAPDAALRALGPLLRTSVENALAQGPVAALTGPIERGDRETVASHLLALDGPLRPLYCAAGLCTVDMAARRGLAPERARELEQLLSRE